ncbi:MAG TPA: carboxypeptidase-like regulatory domain-containing protein [Candidatus Polarisedimenticolia bacterium]|jgi:hypothetical protein
MMPRRARVLIFLAALGLPALAVEPPKIPPPPARQEPIGQVNGTVFDRVQKGVVGMPVTLIPQSGSGIHGTSTDNGGRYAFKGLEAGTYSVIVSMPGGGVLRKDGIRIRPLFRSIVDFTLAADTPESSLPAVGATPAEDADSGSLTFSCALVGLDRAPVPDALVTLTPVGGEGRFRRARTGPDGGCAIGDLPVGRYRVSARAPGFLTWSLGPLPVKGAGPVTLSLSLVPFPMGFAGTLEDLLIPADPIPPSSPSAPADKGN